MTTSNSSYRLSLQLAHLLAKQNKKIAVAESCTGGGLAAEVTAVQGASAWFECGFVVYSNQSKMALLGVDDDILQTHGAVSEATAKAMAKGALNNSQADIGLSITGIAGPEGGKVDKPVGTVWFGLADRDGDCQSRRGTFTSGRKHVRLSSIKFALSWLLEALS